jgi:hypothetical protein
MHLRRAWLLAKTIAHATTQLPVPHEAGLLENSQVTGDLRLGQGERGDEFAHRSLTPAQLGEQLEPRLVSEGPKELRDLFHGIA